MQKDSYPPLVIPAKQRQAAETAVPQFRFLKLHPAARLPARATSGAAAFDVCAIVETPTGRAEVDPYGGTLVIRTGLAVEMPPRWCIKALSRSGHGFKFDVSLANSVGLIDEDYRGEIFLKLRNDGPVILPVETGDRIAQFLFERVEDVDVVWADALSQTARGAGGLGSTGV